MPFRFLTVALLVLFCAHAAFAQSEITSYSDRSSFTAATDNLTTVDFEGIAPNTGFRNFNREGHFTVSGIDFRPGGGARFGPGFVTIVGHQYQAGPAYETATGAKMHWSPPNQPGNAYLAITPPNGTTAVGTDLWAAQPYVSPVEVVVTTKNGSRTFTIQTPNRPAAGFVGVVSDSEITSIRLTPAKGQTGFALDNFSFGRARAGVKRSGDTPRAETPRASVTTPRTEEPLHDPPGLRPEADQPKNRPQAAGGSGGTIAYIRGTEIRAISPDGTNDRRLWTHPDLRPELGLHDLAWRPDGKELAFSSSHAAPFSFYDGDIFAIKPDGSGLRKLTNPPDKSEFARYGKGTVTVTVRNDQDVSATPGSFLIYVTGADEPQQIALPAGTAKTLVFKSVADFGNHPQPVVAMFGNRRWFTPGTDVQAGRNVNSPVFSIRGEGIDRFGAFRPVWRSDGSRISYRSGLCVLSSVSSNPRPGEYSFNPLFGGTNPVGTCKWDWGPTPATANQVIYSENGSDSGKSSIYRMTEGGTHPGTKLTTYSDIDLQILSDLRWMPDASGLLYTKREYVEESADIYRYDFGTKQVTQVTNLKNEFAREFSISPDGRSVVFERCKTRDDDDKICDLWIADVNSGGMRLLVKNAFAPAWGK